MDPDAARHVRKPDARSVSIDGGIAHRWHDSRAAAGASRLEFTTMQCAQFSIASSRRRTETCAAASPRTRGSGACRNYLCGRPTGSVTAISDRATASERAARASSCASSEEMATHDAARPATSWGRKRMRNDRARATTATMGSRASRLQHARGCGSPPLRSISEIARAAPARHARRAPATCRRPAWRHRPGGRRIGASAERDARPRPNRAVYGAGGRFSAPAPHSGQSWTSVSDHETGNGTDDMIPAGLAPVPTTEDSPEWQPRRKPAPTSR